VRLIPKDGSFFVMFGHMCSNLIEGAQVLVDIFNNFQGLNEKVKLIKEIEHRGDDMTHEILTKLNQTFITPFDREDIHRLTSSIDDVLDFINSAGERLVLYKITNPPPAAGVMAKLILEQSEEISKAVSQLKGNKHVLEHCVEVNRLENEADRVTREAIGSLFEHERDPITLIKIKELLETLEEATDRAEDAADVLESVVLKNN
jgi:predicted phosphate transport protein (TIGR00153 family)